MKQLTLCFMNNRQVSNIYMYVCVCHLLVHQLERDNDTVWTASMCEFSIDIYMHQNDSQPFVETIEWNILLCDKISLIKVVIV